MPINLRNLKYGDILKENEGSLLNDKIILETHKWDYFELTSLFKISASSDPLITNLTIGGQTPYISSTEKKALRLRSISTIPNTSLPMGNPSN